MTDALALLRAMVRIRLVEEAIAKRYSEGQMRCPTHLSIGQEAVAAAVGLALQDTDLAVSGHRAHAHYLGKGGDLAAMIAEIYGKETGCAHGKGGSMHLSDRRVGFVGSTAIVGGTVPVGVGLAYGLKMAAGSEIACVFLGDAVAETGVLYESLNFAALKCLPVLFVCENNLYSVYSPLEVRQPAGRKIWQMVEGIGVKARHGDGNDALAVHEMVRNAVEQIRQGQGPVFLEFDTYRWREHCGPNFDNDIGYRSEAEFEQWREKDPIEMLEQRMLASGDFTQEARDAMLQAVAAEIDAAFQAAIAAPFPPPAAAYQHVYANPIHSTN